MKDVKADRYSQMKTLDAITTENEEKRKHQWKSPDIDKMPNYWLHQIFSLLNLLWKLNREIPKEAERTTDMFSEKRNKIKTKTNEKKAQKLYALQLIEKYYHQY